MEIPTIGLGTYQIGLAETTELVKKAIDIGYRHFDTAQLYKNEEGVGQAIREKMAEGIVKRGDVFVTTKVMPKFIRKGSDGIIKSVIVSLEKLGLKYIDLLLLHAPIKNKLIESWNVMEELYFNSIPELAGRVRGIGVSNYSKSDLKTLIYGCKFVPVCNQIEVHPFCQKRDIVKYCQEMGIAIVAHSSLTRGRKFDNGIIVSLAKKYRKTSAQILLKWAVDEGFKVLPRTSNTYHLLDNFRLNFELDAEDKLELDSINESFSLFPHFK